MKLIIAIIRDEESDEVLQALIKRKFRVTRIASTGGFLRRGQTTLMIGVEDDNVEPAIQTVRDIYAPISDPNRHRAIMFVLNVDHFTQV